MNENVTIEVIDSNGDISNSVSIENFKIENPYNVNLNSVFLPNSEPMTLELFFNIAKLLIEDSQKREAIKDIVTLTEEYPPEDITDYGDEVITFRVIERKPGMMDAKGTGRPQRKATYSYEERNPKQPNKVITVESRPVDHVIEFNCWASSNKLANKRAIWLEKLFINSAFVFESKGAERFFFKERLSDMYQTTNGQRLFSRPLRFFLRFREFDAKAESILRQILIDLKITQ